MDASSTITQVSRDDPQLANYPHEKGHIPRVDNEVCLPGQVGKKPKRGVLRSILCCFSRATSSKASKASGGSEGRCSPQLSPGSPRYLLPSIRHQDMHKKCMVIDLDETIVQSSFKRELKYAEARFRIFVKARSPEEEGTLEDKCSKSKLIFKVILKEEEGRTRYAPSEPTVKILKQPSNGGKNVMVNGDSRRAPKVPVKTLQQRELEYAEAKLRIFGEARSPEEEGTLEDKCSNSKPVVIFQEKKRRTRYTPSEPTVKILKRPSNRGKNVMVNGDSSRPPKVPIKTLQQRELEYAEARLRIFGKARSPEEEGALEDKIVKIQRVPKIDILRPQHIGPTQDIRPPPEGPRRYKRTHIATVAKLTTSAHESSFILCK